MKIKIDGIEFGEWTLYAPFSYTRDAGLPSGPLTIIKDWIMVSADPGHDRWYFCSSISFNYLNEIMHRLNPNRVLKAKTPDEAKEEVDKFLAQIAKMRAFQ